MFVWGKTIMVNIEGEKQNIIRKTKMTGGRARHVSGSLAQARYCTPSPKHGTARRLSTPQTTHPSWNGGGDRGCLPWRRLRTAQHVAYPPLENPQQNMTGGESRGHVTLRCEWRSNCLTVAASPKHGTARRLSTPPPPKNQPFVEWGGTGGVSHGVAQA